MKPSEVAEHADDGSFLFVSGHDFRSKRKANVHFITRELARRGDTRLFSMGFSPLSLIKRDPRASLWSRANRVERFEGVECYLWRTPLHPVNLRRRWLGGVERSVFDVYRRLLPRVLREWAESAKTIIIESGLGLVAVDLIREFNRRARIIYLCSDSLETIGCSGYLQGQLRRVGRHFDAICVPSPRLASDFPANAPVFFVPHGLDTLTVSGRKSPYAGGLNVLSVGNMLFDPSFFQLAAPAFPDVHFHIIGGGRNARGLRAANLTVHGEMPYEDTLVYLEHADAGVAPYAGAKVSDYLVDTSMKLMQYAAYGLPAVCPAAVVGGRRGRFGYEPGDARSIAHALRAALAQGRGPPSAALSWREVTDRILRPQAFPDTLIKQTHP